MARQRWAREDRRAQLVETAWAIAREDGSEALTLGRLAERAAVAKPVVYSHFASRPDLLVALYREYDARQHAALEEALDRGPETLAARAAALAASYLDCVLGRGPEQLAVAAALEGSPETEPVKRACDATYGDRCREVLAPFAGSGGVSEATLTAILGAAESLAHAAASGALAPDEGRAELARVIVALVPQG